jgi:uncharacterized protein YqeY
VGRQQKEKKEQTQMSILDEVNEDLKGSMKAKDEVKSNTLRQIKTVVMNTEIKKDKKLIDEEITEVIFSLAKSHNESIESFKKGGRADLVAKEERELAILKTYLPEQLSDGDLQKIIEETIKETGATSLKDIGRVMGKVMPKVKGKADGSKINAAVKQILDKPAQ